MRLKGKKVAVLAEEIYQEMELWVPYYRLKEEGADVKIVAPEKKTYKSKLGYPVNADVAAADVSAKDFDGIVIPGGYAPDMMRRYPAILKLVKDCFDQGKPVAAICHAGWVPASAGILKGKQATCFMSIKDDLINAGAKYVDQEVVVDGNLITSRTPADLPAFCRELVKALEK
jgi:protease I